MTNNIKLSETTQRRLKKIGKMGDSYEDVIKKLINAELECTNV